MSDAGERKDERGEAVVVEVSVEVSVEVWVEVWVEVRLLVCAEFPSCVCAFLCPACMN